MGMNIRKGLIAAAAAGATLAAIVAPLDTASAAFHGGGHGFAGRGFAGGGFGYRGGYGYRGYRGYGGGYGFPLAAGVLGGLALGAAAGGYYGGYYGDCYLQRQAVYTPYGAFAGYRNVRVCG